MLAVVLVIQVGLASGGGWARLTPTVGRTRLQSSEPPKHVDEGGLQSHLNRHRKHCQRVNQGVKMMDPALLEQLLKQYGWTSAAVALAVSFLLTAIFNLGIFYVNQQIERQREEKLERLRTDLEKELAEFKAREIKEIESIQQARWELKYQACLDALEIVDVFLSQWFKDVNGVTPVRQTADTVKARECYSRLALTCQNPEVTETFLRVMFPTPQTDSIAITDNLNALRNAIRRELGFGESISLSQRVAWFVRIAGDKREDTGQEGSSMSAQPCVEPTPTLAL